MSAGGLQSWGIRTYLIIDTKSTEFMGHQESKFSEFAEISFYWENTIPAGRRLQLLTHSPPTQETH